MKTSKIMGWEITPVIGVGRGPQFRDTVFYVLVGPHVRTETRVAAEGLKNILPPVIHAEFLAAQVG
jgi:hypothetical protein